MTTTTAPTIETITEVVDAYLAAWNETDPAKRAGRYRTGLVECQARNRGDGTRGASESGPA